MKTNLLDIIKHACVSTKGRITVTVYLDRYEVYHRPLFEDMVKVTEENLEEFLKALLIIDASDKWE